MKLNKLNIVLLEVSNYILWELLSVGLLGRLLTQTIMLTIFAIDKRKFVILGFCKILIFC